MYTRALTRWVVVGVVAAAGLVVADRAGLATAAGVDVWNLSDLERVLEEEEQAGDRYDAEYGPLADRIRVKDDVTADLLAGRLTLAAATDRFLELNGENPHTTTLLRSCYHATDPRELAARNVLDFAAVSPAPPRGGDKAAALRQLSAEFARLFPAAGAPMHQ